VIIAIAFRNIVENISAARNTVLTTRLLSYAFDSKLVTWCIVLLASWHVTRFSSTILWSNTCMIAISSMRHLLNFSVLWARYNFGINYFVLCWPNLYTWLNVFAFDWNTFNYNMDAFFTLQHSLKPCMFVSSSIFALSCKMRTINADTRLRKKTPTYSNSIILITFCLKTFISFYDNLMSMFVFHFPAYVGISSLALALIWMSVALNGMQLIKKTKWCNLHLGIINSSNKFVAICI
jgi:hypothetical protein